MGGLFLVLSILGNTPVAASVDAIQSLIEKGRYPDAISLADQDLAATPRDPQTRFLKGIALTELDRSDEAITVFKQLTEDYPELPEPYNNLAVLYAQQRQFDKARSALEMAIRTHPSYATAHENLGDVYARLAKQAYDKALQIDSANLAAQSKLALIRQLMSVSDRGATLVAAAPAEAVPLPAPTVKTPAAAPPVAQAPAPAAAPTAPTPAPAVAPAAPTPTPAPTPEPAPVAQPAAPATPAAAPAPAPKPAPAVDKVQQRIETMVLAWAQAWSSKDVPGYLSHYAPDFDPPGSKSLAQWKAERQQRVGDKPGEISVDIRDLSITVTGANSASAVFYQEYRSSGFNGATDKTLKLVRKGDDWLIRQELIGRH
jgi:tetratricopeptide (TPR) repeat protein